MRPWHRWTLFAVALAVVLAALAWSTRTIVCLDRAEAEARHQTALEESVRLVLWRMDSALAPLIAQESGQPYFAYVPFYPAERAYTRMYANISAGDVLMPSPLLMQPQPRVLVHFQIDAAGRFSSPQVPVGEQRNLAEQQGFRSAAAIEDSARRLAVLSDALKPDWLRDRLPLPAVRNLTVVSLPSDQPDAQITGPSPWAQAMVQQQAVRQRPSDGGKLTKGQQRIIEDNSRRAQQQVEAQQGFMSGNLLNVDPYNTNVAAGLMQPFWIEDMLVLARRISANGQEYIQGCQLDWPAIRQWLLADVQDALPAAALEPMGGRTDDRAIYRLAALPVRLIAGPVPVARDSVPSTLRISLPLAWACVLVAATAVAVLLKGAVSLSERRGAFVSAVTHELRTPLTTFRLYTDLLEQGRVTGEEKRRQYLTTLRAQAERLCHLVDNVLAYARLERGNHRRPLETIDLSDWLAQAGPRLAERAAQAGMELGVVINDRQSAVSQEDQAGRRSRLFVRADESAMEQILLNLVDNACKYASGAERKAIEIVAGRRGAGVEIMVRDHGPGIAQPDRRMLFRPFRKSASKAANSAPGVGLGLSLSRRLAREMGGDLRLDSAVQTGACFVLSLQAE
ncbi:MAG: HAMP domain-containing histidine kinase [Phycisphaerae bacterium]|nr:HAMP domain-containing histidine kinase [Phycisphaerae bacterium]